MRHYRGAIKIGTKSEALVEFGAEAILHPRRVIERNSNCRLGARCAQLDDLRQPERPGVCTLCDQRIAQLKAHRVEFTRECLSRNVR